jgi:hypothetical protein
MSCPLWHGYWQHPDAHPLYPWWRAIHTTEQYRSHIGLVRDTFVSAWVRTDGKRISAAGDGRGADEKLVCFDRETPLPRPPPKVGQVWALRYSDCWDFASIVGVRDYDNGLWLFRFVGCNRDETLESVPGDALLVAGPDSPWQNTSNPS